MILDGSGSSDSDGNIVSYVWSEGGSQIASGVTPTVSFAVDTHTVTLEVTDNDGASDSDTVLITVLEEGSKVGPTADAGEDQTVVDSDNSGAEEVTLDGSDSSDSDGTVASYMWSEGGSQIASGVTPTVSFAVGMHNVMLEVTDNDGTSDSDMVLINVSNLESYVYLPLVIKTGE